jgi:hypothetical protein
MKAGWICLALLLGQVISLRSEPVVHLTPNRDVISAEFGGKLLELINAPATLYLPASPPESDSMNHPWFVDVKNLGPDAVVIDGRHAFRVHIAVGQTVHIHASGSGYLLR